MYMRDSDGHVFQTDYPQYHKGAEKLGNVEGKHLLQMQCAKELRPLFGPKRQIYAIIRHVSASGMTRYIEFYSFDKGGLTNITSRMSVVTGWTHHKKGLVVTGCGMDMVFHTVDTVARTIGLKKLPNYSIL